MWIYLILPIAALSVQMFIYGSVLLGLANMISLVIIFLFLQAEQGRRMAEQENQLTQSRIAIMLSQIQPHFLYNCLTTIDYLCQVDPRKAQQAVEHFATYLRGNLDSLNRTTLVAFDKELEHIRHYVSLEKMRFDEAVQVVYDLQITDFLLPALTVQPLVENAIKHGLGKKECGGTVTIATRETVDSVQIIVSDDGVGYDPMEKQHDGRTHIGIDQVRARLAAMCQGSLAIESKPNVGTTATITIPSKTAE